MKPVYYMQTDPKWTNIPYTIDGDKHETIGYSGCGPTCAAMILATWIDPKITPVETSKMAIEMKDRTANDGTEWEFFKHIAERYSLEFKQTGSTQEAIDALKAGALVVCSMGPGYFTKGGHFVLAWSVDDSGIKVLDPISTARTGASKAVFEKECRQYFIFKNHKINDMDKASPWAKQYIEKAIKYGLISGGTNGNINPQRPATREEMIASQVILYEKLKGDKP